MQGTTIFLAGSEIEKLTYSLLDNGITHLLYSYYYILRFSKEGFVDKIKNQYPHVQIFLDSGAFTYGTVMADGGNRKLPPPERYKDLYFQYVRDFGGGFHRVSELDIDGIPDREGNDIVPYEQVIEWLEELLDTYPHLPVMPTYHGWRPRSMWTSWCKDPRVKCMAIGRHTGEVGLQRMLVMEAERAKKPVHGFAMTKFQTTLTKVPYDSVDSSSWVMGQKYGLTYIFQNNKWKVLTGDEKIQRRRYRHYFTSIGVNADLVEADNVDEVRKANVIAWRNICNRYEEMKKRRHLLTGIREVGALDDTDMVVEPLAYIPEKKKPFVPRNDLTHPPDPRYSMVVSPNGQTVRVRAPRPLAGLIGIKDPTRRKA